MKEIVFLIVKADRSVRIAKKPRINHDEVKIRVVLDFPGSWGREVAKVELKMPEFVPSVDIEVIDPE